MEVHHHSHPSTGSGHRKKWTHYFWEFIMLFLAVFCGFMAENLREHQIENNRAKEYAKQLLEDLKRDTADIVLTSNDCVAVLSFIDSLQNIADVSVNGKDISGAFYYYSRLVTSSPSVDWHRTTLNQIINSGNVRYFKNKELLNKISYYDEVATLINSQHSNDRAFRAKTMELRSQLLNSKNFGIVAEILLDDYSKIPDSIAKSRYPLQSNNKDLLNEYLNSCQNRKATLNLLKKRDLPLGLATAKELIEIIKKEYKIK